MQKATIAFEKIFHTTHCQSLSNKKGIIIMGIKIELHILCQITHITDYYDDRHTSKQYLESRIKNSCRRFNQGDIPSKKEITRILGGYYYNNITTNFSVFFSLLAKGVVIQPQVKNWTISHINNCDQRELYIFKKIRTFRYTYC